LEVEAAILVCARRIYRIGDHEVDCRVADYVIFYVVDYEIYYDILDSDVCYENLESDLDGMFVAGRLIVLANY
jgi:hypothetical protein